MGIFNRSRRSEDHRAKTIPVPAGMEIEHIDLDAHGRVPGLSVGGTLGLRPTAPGSVEAAQLEQGRRIEARLTYIGQQQERTANALEELKPEVRRLATAIEDHNGLTREQNRMLREIRERSTPIIESTIVRELPEPRRGS